MKKIRILFSFIVIILLSACAEKKVNGLTLDQRVNNIEKNLEILSGYRQSLKELVDNHARNLQSLKDFFHYNFKDNNGNTINVKHYLAQINEMQTKLNRIEFVTMPNGKAFVRVKPIETEY